MVETSGGRGKAVREFLYGMFGYEHAQQALEIRASMDSLFMIMVFGDMIGVPVMPPYYSLRLLPYVARSLEGWKRRTLRERQFGQIDHVRIYGLDYVDRLQDAGFSVEQRNLTRENGSEFGARFGLLANEELFVCTPLGS